MSDIPDYIYELLGNETDQSTRRNAFAFLMECKQTLAIDFLENNCDDVHFLLQTKKKYRVVIMVITSN